MRTTDKPFNIDKKQVYEAYKAVKSNAGAAGVDGQTIEQFEADLKGNLYKIWNRMSSGSYFPPPVRAVSIPKKTGGQRILGVPTVADRVAQMVVKQLIEPDLEPIFLADSYGYRPRKSALDAVGVTRERCWKYDWVLEFDIKGLFDNIDHELLLRAVRKHVTCKWALLYIERWLTAPMEQEDGDDSSSERAAPRKGVWSARFLSNLFLHYAFDLWMTRTHPDLPGVGMRMMGWCTAGPSKKRKPSRPSFKHVWRSAAWRCIRRKPRSSTARTESAKASIRTSSLTSSGTAFGRGWSRSSRDNKLFCGFNPAVSPSALKAMRSTIRDLNIRHQTQLSLDDIARQTQSAPAGVDRVLRAIRSIGAVPFAPIRQSDASWPGRCGSSSALKAIRSARVSFLQRLAREQRGSLRALADRYDRHVCLMGAE